MELRLDSLSVSRTDKLLREWLLYLLFNITDLEFLLISAIHYDDADWTLGPDQCDAPTLSIDSHQTSGLKRQIEKQINKKPALLKERFAFYRNHFLYHVEHNSCFYCRVLAVMFNIQVRGQYTGGQGEAIMPHTHKKNTMRVASHFK